MKITANMMTISRIVLMPIPGYLLYQDANLLFVCIAVVAVLGLTDYVDGIMARAEGPTVLGSLLDPIADKIFIAVIYLPLTERYVPEWGRVVIPLWMIAIIFSRDFLVTSLRTGLSLRDAPMRTSTLAKFKTAIQMIGIGYILFFLAAHLSDMDTNLRIYLLCVPIVIPLSLIIYRLVKGKKQGQRSVTMIALMTVAVIIFWAAGTNLAGYLIMAGITGLTAITGLSYLSDAWSAFRGKPGLMKEMGRFIMDGLLVPLVFLFLIGRYEMAGMSALIILSFTLELALGGLGNLLASQKISPRFRWVALKSSLQVLFGGGALAIWYFDVSLGIPLGEILIACATLVTVIFSGISLWRHRDRYLSQI